MESAEELRAVMKAYAELDPLTEAEHVRALARLLVFLKVDVGDVYQEAKQSEAASPAGPGPGTARRRRRKMTAQTAAGGGMGLPWAARTGSRHFQQSGSGQGSKGVALLRGLAERRRCAVNTRQRRCGKGGVTGTDVAARWRHG
ncbi:hypothetical protein [Streptomyces sp. Ac-502]|uniref:hypothetical protein n=1 Tax=Streptomyces sp. Ac-502 TaxID=3342801 RepID=UPI00386266B8